MMRMKNTNECLYSMEIQFQVLLPYINIYSYISICTMYCIYVYVYIYIIIYSMYIVLPSSKRTWQWEIHCCLWFLRLQPPFLMDLRLPCLIAGGYVCMCIYVYIHVIYWCIALHHIILSISYNISTYKHMLLYIYVYMCDIHVMYCNYNYIQTLQYPSPSIYIYM